MNKKLISLMLTVVLLLSFLTACSSSQASATSASTAKTDTATTASAAPSETTNNFAGEELSILVSQDWMNNYYDGIIANFEKKYSVTVDLQTVPADQYFDLLKSKLTTGNAPDIFWIQSNPFAIKSFLVDPASYCMDFTGASWQNIIPKERLSACMADDKLYGLMLWTNSPEYVMMYNKSLFNELGITQTPSTYAELKADCEKIAAKKITPWFVPGADGWQHQLAFFQIGGAYEQAQPGLYDKLNNNTATFAGNAKMLEVLGQMKELSDKGYFGDDWIGTDSTDMANLFGSRKIAMAMANPGYINQVQKETNSKDEFGLFLIPLGDNQNYPTNPAGPIMMGYKDSKHAELVKAFFDFCTTKESIQALLDAHTNWTNIAVNEDVVPVQQHWLAAEKELIDKVPADKRQTPVLQTGTKYTNDYWMDFGKDMIAYFTGQMKANDVLANMDAKRAEAAKQQKDPNWK